VILVATIVLLLSLRDSLDVTAAWPVLEIAVILAALPSIFCWVRNDSPGAVDNASGVGAVLLAAASASSARDLGVLITSAEELGLKKGDQVKVVIKSTEVMLQKEGIRGF